MNRKKVFGKAMGMLLAAVVFFGMIALAAEYGTQNDPLVSLSYINSVFAPEIKAQVEKSVDKQISTFSGQIDAKISSYKNSVDSKISEFVADNASFVANKDVIDTVSAAVAQRVQNQGTGTSSFSLLKISSGQTIVCSVGTEILLRLGSASCVSSGTPGLIDTTNAQNLPGGSALVKNHLYLCTVNGRGVTTSSGATVMIRGSYTVK